MNIHFPPVWLVTQPSLKWRHDKADHLQWQCGATDCCSRYSSLAVGWLYYGHVETTYITKAERAEWSAVGGLNYLSSTELATCLSVNQSIFPALQTAALSSAAFRNTGEIEIKIKFYFMFIKQLHTTAIKWILKWAMVNQRKVKLHECPRLLFYHIQFKG